MSRITNVWSCADEGNAIELRKALRLVRHAASVLGWSYAGGQRRGIVFDESAGIFVSSDSKCASPASILHFAALTGNMDVALVAFSNGAHSMVRLDAPGRPPWGAATCVDIARQNNKSGLVSDEFVNLLELSAIRESEDIQKLFAEEAFQRSLLMRRYMKAVAVLECLAGEGLIEITVEVRGAIIPVQGEGQPDGSSATGRSTTAHPTIHLTVRRSISRNELREQVSGIVGQSVALSVLLPAGDSSSTTAALLGDPAQVNPVALPDGRRTPLTSSGSRAASPATVASQSSLSVSRLGSRPRTRGGANSSMVRAEELSSRNIRSFLTGPGPFHMIARPLINPLLAMGGDASLMASTDVTQSRPVSRAAEVDQSDRERRMPVQPVTLDEIRSTLEQYRRSATPSLSMSKSRCATPLPLSMVATGNATSVSRSATASSMSHVEAMRDLVRRFDEAAHAAANKDHNASLLHKTLQADTETTMLSRLYDNEVKVAKEKRVEYLSTIEEGAKRLIGSRKVGGLSAEMEESVSRLCYEGVSRRLERIAEIESAVLAAVPRARESTLEPEDSEAARERLTSSAKHDEELSALRLRYLGEGKPVKRLSKGRVEALVGNVFTKAIEKKLSSLSKLEAEYGDFRLRKAPSKKITRTEEAEIGARLTKKA